MCFVRAQYSTHGRIIVLFVGYILFEKEAYGFNLRYYLLTKKLRQMFPLLLLISFLNFVLRFGIHQDKKKKRRKERAESSGVLFERLFARHHKIVCLVNAHEM